MERIEDVAFRLMQLEQRLDSFTIVREEEINKIRKTLRQLRGDVIRLMKLKDLGREADGEKGALLAEGSDESPPKAKGPPAL